MVRLSEVGSFWLEEGGSSIAVSGAWLSQFGFEVGRKVVIDASMGEIVIKLVDVEEGVEG